MRASPALTVTSEISPNEWAQNWAHEFSDAANHSEICTFRGLPSLPWAQRVSGLLPKPQGAPEAVFGPRVSVSSQGRDFRPAFSYSPQR